jgi:hypothetical protein
MGGILSRWVRWCGGGRVGVFVHVCVVHGTRAIGLIWSSVLICIVTYMCIYASCSFHLGNNSRWNVLLGTRVGINIVIGHVTRHHGDVTFGIDRPFTENTHAIGRTGARRCVASTRRRSALSPRTLCYVEIHFDRALFVVFNEQNSYR